MMMTESRPRSFRAQNSLAASGRAERSVSRRNELTQFLRHLRFMLDRIPKCSTDEYINELGDAVKRLIGDEAPPQICPECPSYLDMRCLRERLEEVAGKVLKGHNALDKEIKCDRYVTAYCHLKEAYERVNMAAKAESHRAHNAYIADLLSYDHDADDSDFGDYPVYLRNSANRAVLANNTSPKIAVTRKAFLHSFFA